MHRDNRCVYMVQVYLYVCCSECVVLCGNVCCVVGFALGVLVFVSVGNVMDVVYIMWQSSMLCSA